MPPPPAVPMPLQGAPAPPAPLQLPLHLPNLAEMTAVVPAQPTMQTPPLQALAQAVVDVPLVDPIHH